MENMNCNDGFSQLTEKFFLFVCIFNILFILVFSLVSLRICDNFRVEVNNEYLEKFRIYGIYHEIRVWSCIKDDK